MNKVLSTLAAALIFATLSASAAPLVVPFTSDTTIYGKLTLPTGSDDLNYLVSDGVTLTYSGTNNQGASGSIYNAGNTPILTMGGTVGGTGKIVFMGSGSPSNPSVGAVGSTKQGGALNFTTSGTITLTNATFQNFWAVGQGGAMLLGTAPGPKVTLNNVLFQNNGASVNGGAIYISTNGNLIVNSGTFRNNTANGFVVSTGTYGGTGGAITMWGATGSITIKDVVFSGNSAVGTSGNGGAVYARTGKSYFLNPVFVSNTASNNGGAVNLDNGNISTWDITKNLSYVGNTANGSAAAGLLTTPTGTAGGLVWLNGSNTAMLLNIAAGSTLTIGSAANTELDTIATSGSTNALVINAPAADSTITAANATGALILHGASTQFSGSVVIANGSVLLGNNAAALVGKITVAGPATIGGVGTLGDDTYGVSAAAGATLQVGAANISDGLLTLKSGAFAAAGNLTGSGTLAGALSLGGMLTANITDASHPLTLTAALSGPGTITKTGAGTLAIASDNAAYTGAITVTGGALRLDATGTLGGNVTINNGGALAIAGTSAAGGAPAILGTLAINNAKISLDTTLGTAPANAATVAFTGNNAVDVTKLVAGAHTFLNSASVITSSGTIVTTYKNAALSARTTANYTGIGTNSLTLTLTVTSATRTWSGAADTNWNFTGMNWSEGDKLFQDGDSAIFAGTGANIAIATAGVIASDLRVANTSGTHTINGGSIETDATAWQSGVNTSTGKLIKTGAGTLVLNNTANNFRSGIDISGGLIAFADAAQIGTLNTAGVDQGITFSAATGTLQFTAATGTIANKITIASGATAALDITTGALTHTGTIVGTTATLAKNGAGTLRLTADNSAYTGATNINAGMLHFASTAKLGGAIAINTTGTLAGNGNATGSVTANPGSTIRVGGTTTSSVPEILTINGALSLNTATVALKTKVAGATMTNDKITVGTLALSGTNTISLLGSFVSGTYTLINTTGASITGFNAANFITTNNGEELDDRVDRTYTTAGNNLNLILMFSSRTLTWSGTGDDIWASNYGNWDGNAATFLGGDSVKFDGITDTAHPANRAIAIDENGVLVADMLVTGSASYTFTGGPIIGSTANTTVANPTGALTMNGTGKVTLATDEATAFQGGIRVNTGTVAGTPLALGTNTITVAAPASLELTGADFDNFAGVATGAGTTVKSGTATIGLTPTGTIATATFNINQGAFAMNSGAVKVTTLNVNNTGELHLSAGDFNAATLNINHGGTVRVYSPVAISVPTLNNAGRLAIGYGADPVNPLETLTLNGNYNGQGGTITLGAKLATGLSDHFTINGNATGSSLIDIVHASSEIGAPTTGDGIQILSITGNNTLDLALAHEVNAGLYNYELHNIGGAYYLRSELSPAIMTANVAPAIAFYAGRANLDTIQTRLGELRFNPKRDTGLWLRASHREDTLQKELLRDVKVETNVWQVGLDRAFAEVNNTSDNWILGAYYARTEAKGKMTNGARDENNSNGLGLYAIYGRGNFYIQALGKADYIDAKITTSYDTRKMKGTIIGGALETGYNLPVKHVGTLVPEFQFTYQYVKIEESADNMIPRYTYQNLAAPTVRGGLRWTNAYRTKLGPVTPWLRASYAYDAKGRYTTHVTDTVGQTYDFANNLCGGRVILDGGITLQITDRWNLYFSGGYETGQRSETWTANAGLRHMW